MTQASLPSVMAVDDRDVLRSLVRRRLEHGVRQVFEAADGDKTIAAFEEVQPNVRLTDRVIRDREGVARIIETPRRRPQVKFVAMRAGVPNGLGYLSGLASQFRASAVIRNPFKFGEPIKVLAGLATAAYRIQQPRLGATSFEGPRCMHSRASQEQETAMLDLRPGCECCDKDLPPESTDARICSFECTFCSDCADRVLAGRCPNCGGELVVRPRRPADALIKNPPVKVRTHKPFGCIRAA